MKGKARKYIIEWESVSTVNPCESSKVIGNGAFLSQIALLFAALTDWGSVSSELLEQSLKGFAEQAFIL